MDQRRPSVSRRHTLGWLVGSSATFTLACSNRRVEEITPARPSASQDDPAVVLRVEPLPQAGPWPTLDPFLFCAHHDDHYPRANGEFGPDAPLVGRNLGQDFAGKDGWNMYHGESVPGFPAHPHRGFETVTVVRRGLLDHADSLGAAARYGEGDVQWLTAGAGIQHAEMFPLLSQSDDNPLELFQIWLNLPSRSKRVEPAFSMLWAHTIPTVLRRDSDGRAVEVSVRAGTFEDARAPAPPPNSWAADAENHVAIWTIRLEPGARFDVPAAPAGLGRALYFFRGSELRLAGRTVPPRQRVTVRSDAVVRIENGNEESELLLLQGRPIGEPIARRGPFVMNTPEEIREAYRDYGATRFGGWPWDSSAPVHGARPERFARRPDGTIERPT
ncbi:MAG TPA: pirin family protein [Polyangiaceae bacterium]|nr:pirin family protein [Polyangiaceae bacterium]